MRLTRLCLTVLSLTLLSAPIFADEKPWIEVKSPHFRLITNGEQSDGRHVLQRFELMRAVFAAQAGFKLDAPAPLLIIAARDERTMKKLLPGFVAHSMPLPGGLYEHGWEREYAVVRLDIIKVDPEAYHSVYHEYVHSLLHINFHWLPNWLDEGLAEFYGSTEFIGDKVDVGAPPAVYKVRTLKAMTLIPFNDFLASRMYTRNVSQSFESYLQAWALTHFLMLSPAMDSGQRLGKFLQLLDHGTPQKKAFQEAIGPFDDVQKEYERYVHKLTFPMREGPAPPKLEESDFQTRTLEPGETEAELATRLIRSHEWEPMRQYSATALQKGPKLSLAHEASGFLLFNEGHDQDALKEFSTAAELDNKNYVALFAKAMIEKSSSSNNQQALYDQLNQVIDLKPDFAPAYIELAKINLSRGDLRLALAITRKAEQIEPFRAGYRVLSAKILLAMNRSTEAASEVAYVAERWGGVDREEAMEVWNSIPAKDRQVQQPTEVEDANKDTTWQNVEGTVKEVSCSGMDFAVTLDVKGHPQTFKTKGFPVGFSDTLWMGRDHFTPCYHVQGLRAVLKYKPAKDSSYEGDLVVAGFRDDRAAAPTTTAVEATAK
jgi:tetratricopeptide (TPR) repeat protein